MITYAEMIKERKIRIPEKDVLIVELLGEEVQVVQADWGYLVKLLGSIATPEYQIPRGNFALLCRAIAELCSEGAVKEARKRANKKCKREYAPWDVRGHVNKKYTKIVANMIKDWFHAQPVNKYHRFYKLCYAHLGKTPQQIYQEVVIDWIGDDPIKLLIFAGNNDTLPYSQMLYERWKRTKIGNCAPPRGISKKCVMTLLRHHAPRLPKSRIIWEMYAYLLEEQVYEMLNIVERSTPQQARKAMEVANRYNRCSNVKLTSIITACMLMRDVSRWAYSRPGITVVGMVEESVDWHQEQKRAKLPKQKVLFDYLDVPDRCGRVKLRPIRDNVELFYEGQDMKHCVGGYSWQCQNGSFMVHAETVACQATIELRKDADGRLVINQCYGVENRYNADISAIRSVVTAMLRKRNIKIIKQASGPVHHDIALPLAA